VHIQEKDLKQYRVHKITRMGQDEVSRNLVWSGSDTDDLSREHPPSEIWGADPLGHSEIDGGHIQFDFLFESSEDGENWQECEDPRRRITPMTDLEMEIDAENRRMFPGDYIEDEYDDYQDEPSWDEEPPYDSQDEDFDTWPDDYDDSL
jgi:hypothetical protein